MYNRRILKYATTPTFSPRWELVDDGVCNSRILKQTAIGTFLPHQVVVSFTTSYLAACRLLWLVFRKESYFTRICRLCFSFRTVHSVKANLVEMTDFLIDGCSPCCFEESFICRGWGFFFVKLLNQPSPADLSVPFQGTMNPFPKNAVVSGVTCFAHRRRFSAIRLCSVVKDISKNWQLFRIFCIWQPLTSTALASWVCGLSLCSL